MKHYKRQISLYQAKLLLLLSISNVLLLSGCAFFQSNEDIQRANLERLKEKFPSIDSTVNASGEIAKVRNIEATATYGSGILQIAFSISNRTDLVMETFNATLENRDSGEEYDISNSDCEKPKLKPGESTICSTTGIISMYSSGGDPYFDSLFGSSIMRDMLKNLEGKYLAFKLSSVTFSSDEFEGTIKY